MTKIVSIVGARPQFVKLAPIHRELTSLDCEHIIVHTGQHYDANMSQNLFEDFGIPDPDVNLQVGSGGHGEQTGRMLTAIEKALLSIKPDKVLVYGDTNSTIAGALAAAKLHFFVAHLEAGLRSHNRHMPEEINRCATDHVSDLCLAPTQNALSILRSEGLASRSVLVGDVMADVCISTMRSVTANPPTLPKGVPSEFAIATIHRAENTDAPGRLDLIMNGLAQLPVPVVLPGHPRLVNKLARSGKKIEDYGIIEIPPLTYSDLIYAVTRSSYVVTDSGGLQKESFLLNKVCTTVRPQTEWPETFAGGMNCLVEPSEIPRYATREAAVPAEAHPFGRGDAASHVAAELMR